MRLSLPNLARFTPEEYSTFWMQWLAPSVIPYSRLEPGSLATYPQRDVEALPISREAKAFLIHTGISTDFHPQEFYPSEIASLTDLEELPDEYARFAVLGRISRVTEDNETQKLRFVPGEYICIDKQANGRVVQIDDSQGHQIVFLNSGVPQMMTFLLFFRLCEFVRRRWLVLNPILPDREYVPVWQTAWQSWEMTRAINSPGTAQGAGFSDLCNNWSNVLDEVDGDACSNWHGWGYKISIEQHLGDDGEMSI